MTQLKTNQLVAAYRVIAKLYDTSMIYADVHITNRVENDTGLTFTFRLGDICHGIASVDANQHLHLKQFTAGEVIYSEFYGSRHGNREMCRLIMPILESKLLPAL